jgi:excisionase family DNA binding protein
MQQEHFYTVDEVAKMLRVSDRTIRKHIEKGLLRALSVGKVYRITQTDLEDYFERIKTKRSDS